MDGQNFNQNYTNGSNNNYQDNTNAGSNNYQDNTNSGSNSYQNYTSMPSNIYGQPEVPENNNNSLAIVSLVLGILSIVSCCCGIGFIFSIAGIICGISANKKRSSGMATAGIICSIVGIVLSVVAIMYYVIMIAGGYLDSYYYYY